MIRGRPLPAVKYATLHAVLAAAAGSEHALTFVDVREQETRLAYREVYRRARRVAHALVELGIRPGDRVAVGVATSPGFMDAFFGVVLAGAVPAPLCLAPRAGRSDEHQMHLTRMLRAIEARLLLVDACTGPGLAGAVEEAGAALGLRAIEGFAADRAGPEVEVAVEPAALGLIQFSSGSTGAPRGVALPHRALVTQLAMLDAVFGEGREGGDLMVSWLPLYHDMGLIGCLLTSMYMRIGLVLMAPEVFVARPQLWLRAVSRHRGTITGAPNFAYELCMRRIPESELAALELGSLRQVFNGAEPVSAALMEAFARRFASCGLRQDGVLRPVYGLAEATLAVTYPPRRAVRWLGVDPSVLAREGRVVPGPRKLTSVGPAVPGVAIEVRDERREPLPEGQLGRIFVRTPSRMQGYFADPCASAGVLVGEWLDTGDLGFVEQGELFIAGRARDLVILRGANYPPQDFEDCLAEVEAVRPGRIVAAGFVPGDGESEQLLILAERNGETDDTAAVTRIRRTILAATGVRAHTIVLLPGGTLRRTSSGKIRRRDALERFLAGAFDDADRG